ncbi:MAG: hypothetical protein ACYTG4_13905 [Planctomycetota bacterium]
MKGDYAYISRYSLGVRVVDISDPYNITEVGYYDTYPAGNGGGYPGCWGALSLPREPTSSSSGRRWESAPARSRSFASRGLRALCRPTRPQRARRSVVQCE